MRRWEQAPKLDSQVLSKILPLLNDPALSSYISKANNEYYHWDEFRRRTPPLGLKAIEAWMGVKSSRLNYRALPLLDKHGKPFTYWLPDHAQQILHVVDRQGGGALAAEKGASIAFAEMRDRVLIDSLMEEAIATSQIEGAVTTRRVAKELLRSGRRPKDRSEQMIVNGYHTIRLLRDCTDRPLTLDLIHDIQENMTRDTLDDPADARRIRNPEDDIHVVDSRDGEIIFTPPPAKDLEARLQRLIDFANTDPNNEPFIHPLIQASMLHFWLAYEHPYVDGNGRTARALFYWAMLKSGYWLFEFLTISRIIHASAMKYYRSFLHSETDDNDLTYFLSFQLAVTRKSLEELHGRLHEMSEQQQRVKAFKLAARLNARQRVILDHAIRNPQQIYTFESHQHSHGITYQTARTDLLGLADRGLLIESGSLRPREFLPAPDLSRKLGLKRFTRHQK